jgi:transposase-like protein
LKKKINRFFEQSDNIFLQMGRDFVEMCPKCTCIKISVRKRKKPKYKCHDCGYEFDNPKALIAPKTQKQKKEIGKQYSNPDQ